MTLLSYAYRIASNFVFLGLVYFSLNFLERYEQRATVAILVLVYAAMHAFGDVTELRHAGEIKAYIDLFFLALVILLCIAKIVTS
ncbi:hypothetical protein [Bradyrhizobium jicamae]|uniref:hypothetical protein n=1 Tax=Bradyrhizobium jicamae TaxID=280332 RepID=UPI001BADFE16|nr:hypothetical protein [Bradyrhizobium jicamae]MBR0936413.1 hypothetical protein [Bradyrhizobium jicamae]